VPRKYVLLLVLSLSIIALDQWTKFLAVGELTSLFDQPRIGSVEPSADKLKAFFGDPPPPGVDGLHFRPKRMVTVSDDFFRFRYAENPGAAFSLFGDLPPHVRGPFFHIISIGAVLLILLYFRKLDGKDPTHRWAVWGLPLVLGGAVGNYVDRIARGFVIDFLEAHWMHQAYWPAFNIADSAICVGVGLLLVDGFLRKEPAVEAEKLAKQTKGAKAKAS